MNREVAAGDLGYIQTEFCGIPQLPLANVRIFCNRLCTAPPTAFPIHHSQSSYNMYFKTT